MKISKTLISLYILIGFGCFYSCYNTNNQKIDPETFIENNISFASKQYNSMISFLKNFEEIQIPKTFTDGKIKTIPIDDWTSGFFSGSLWYIYELTGDDRWKDLAIKYTEELDSIQYYTGNHDIGFMIGCSYGNAFRLTKNNNYKNVIIRAAKSLSTRYNSTVGLVQSWDANSSKSWQYPVIIDNMMNLELLFDATELSGDSIYYEIAISHADKTILNHYRSDYSTWHVIDYNPTDGSVRGKKTHQGYSDESCWSRGQSWGAYGYIMCYRKTKDPKYLAQAEKSLNFILNHPNYPEDGIPYWDFNTPDIPNSYRDVSAASILASALYELSLYSVKQDYKAWADKIMNKLGSADYRAVVGENGNFLLMHSVGNLPNKSEIDVPLNYADYYFLEALKRKKELEK